jgi:hypothetical protein
MITIHVVAEIFRMQIVFMVQINVHGLSELLRSTRLRRILSDSQESEQATDEVFNTVYISVKWRLTQIFMPRRYFKRSLLFQVQ